jgi:integral membrane sensor domain MASE1
MFESVARPRPMSRGFRCALFGIAMTILARLGPWSWPGWPAVTVLDLVLTHAAPSVVGPVLKGLGLVALMLVNVASWALVAYAALHVWRRRHTR